MKKIYINEEQLVNFLKEKKEEVTFYEFMINTKKFLKNLLKKPSDVEMPNLFKKNNIKKGELIDKLKDKGILSSSERIDEVPIGEGETKKTAKRYIKYSLRKDGFDGKMHDLYDEFFDNTINEDEGGGATSCGSAMQGGGFNPDAGQYTVPFSNVQRREIYNIRKPKKRK